MRFLAPAAALILAKPFAASAQTDPPGTAAERALDRATDGRNADGTRGAPPGTAAERIFDRAAGTNASGAFPAQRDGTPANPPGTAAGRALDRATR